MERTSSCRSHKFLQEGLADLTGLCKYPGVVQGTGHLRGAGRPPTDIPGLRTGLANVVRSARTRATRGAGKQVEEAPELADGGATCGGGARGRTRGDNPASKAYNLRGWGKWGVRSRRRHRAPAEEALAEETQAEAVGT